MIEAVVLIFWRRQRAGADHRRRASAIEIVLLLLPGICLMLAIRAALSGAAWPWVPVALIAALVAHLADLRERWRG